MDNVKFIEESYESAHRPMYNSRSRELEAVFGYCAHYGVIITAEEFDTAIANLFGDGAEFEWDKD